MQTSMHTNLSMCLTESTPTYLSLCRGKTSRSKMPWSSSKSQKLPFIKTTQLQVCFWPTQDGSPSSWKPCSTISSLTVSHCTRSCLRTVHSCWTLSRTSVCLPRLQSKTDSPRAWSASIMRTLQITKTSERITQLRTKIQRNVVSSSNV